MIIDIHTHLANHHFVPEYFIDGLIDETSALYYKATKQEVGKHIIKNMLLSSFKDFDSSKHLKQMEEAGISKSVLLIADWGYQCHEFDLEDIYKAYSAILSENKDKFIVFSGIDPRRGKEGLDLFEKSITKYGFKGLKLYPPCGFELNDKIMYPVYEICEKYRLPVLSHTGPSLGNMKTEKEFPSSIKTVAKEFKNINFILGHAAILYEETCKELPLEHDNIFLEVSGFQSIIKNKDIIKTRLTNLFKMIPEHVLFGTDWPMFSLSGTQKKWIDFFKDLQVLTDKQEEQFFSSNALRALNLKN